MVCYSACSGRRPERGAVSLAGIPLSCSSGGNENSRPNTDARPSILPHFSGRRVTRRPMTSHIQDGTVGSGAGPRSGRPKRRAFTAEYKMQSQVIIPRTHLAENHDCDTYHTDRRKPGTLQIIFCGL